MNCDPLTQLDKMFWILEEHDNTKLSSDFESDVSNNTYLARFWKLKILQCLYELIKRFVTQPSSKFFFNSTQKFTKQTNNRTISKQYSSSLHKNDNILNVKRNFQNLLLGWFVAQPGVDTPEIPYANELKL